MAKHIVDSSFYSKSFDGAIFDGPIRIYFAQIQEQTGLELHDAIVRGGLAPVEKIKELNRTLKREIYFFIYPDEVDFAKHRPPCQNQAVFISPFLASYVIGFSESTFNANRNILNSYLDFICENWLSAENFASFQI